MSPLPVSEYRGSGAVAVTPHHLATEAALSVMREGGNAADAVIAANAVLGTVLPTTCGVGGDLFAIVHRPGMEAPEVLNASGRGGSGLDADALRAGGLKAIPRRSPESITVPGCVDGWEALAGRHGSRNLARLLAPAISLAEDGFEVSKELADDLVRIQGVVAGQDPARALYPGGSPPPPGTVLRRPDLAGTLGAIATEGRHAFYSGRVAAAIVAATDGVLAAADLEANRPDWVPALGADLFGLRAWTVPPNSQGYLTLAAATLFEALDTDPDPADPAFHHALIEAYRAVAWERDLLVSDPSTAPMDPSELLDRARLLPRIRRISDHGVSRWAAPRRLPGGTAYFCAVDPSGMAVSCIQSNFTGIGSGIGATGTGVFLHNRGAGFTLEQGHPNEATPGRRPMHTLSPTLWTRCDSVAMLLGTRGGDQQPQYLLQMAALMLAAGLSPPEAQRSWRWHAEGRNRYRSVLSCELGVPEEVVAGLRARGHAVESGPGLRPGWGPVSVVAVAPDGTRWAAADPRVGTASAGGT